MLSRRGFIAGLTAAAAPVPGWAAAGHPVALSAAMLPDKSFALIGLRAGGTRAFTLPLPARGHAGAAHPHAAEAVVIARRPGTFALVVDCASGQLRQTLTAPKGRHFYGHAAFTLDGNLLLTTENDFATGEGRVGVWDRRLGYERIDEFSSGGVGPHEIIRLPDGNFAVANGGIRTHPDKGREKLNLDTMRPNLSILTPDGRVRTSVPANAAQNSLRHIAADGAGGIIVGYQWQGDPYAAPPLVAVFEDGKLTDFASDPAHALGLEAYIGSVSAHKYGAVITSPRGGQVQVYGLDGAHHLTARAPDVCGLCNTGTVTLATDGAGQVYRVDETGLTRLARHDLAFDNHLVAV